MAIKLKDLVFDVKKTLEGKLLLVEEPKVYEGYKEGVKTGPEGLAFFCLSPNLNYEKISIKVPGNLQMPFQYDGSPMLVEFENLEGKVWQDWSNKGEIKLSITAKSVRPMKEKHIKISTEGDKA